MTEQNVIHVENKQVDNRGKLAGGIVLIGIGLGLLVFNTLDMGLYFPLVLGLIFLAAGIATRKSGFLIPGGIIGGVGLGTISTASGWFFPVDSTESGGMFLLFFSLGWFAIPVLSRLFTRDTHTWALIPGAVMAVIGGLVMLGETGTDILELVGKFWPVILILVGAGVLLGWWKERK